MNRSQIINNAGDTAYMIYTDPNRTESARYDDMQRYLTELVKYGAISWSEKFKIADDIIGD